MAAILEYGKLILANYQTYAALINGLLTAMIAIALVIPGEQPEKFLQGIVDFLAKFSKKPADKIADK